MNENLLEQLMMTNNSDKEQGEVIKIYKVVGSLDLKGWSHYVYPIFVVEKERSFIGESTKITKDRLLKIEAMIKESHKKLIYFTYCREGEQQKCLDAIKRHIIQKVETYKSDIDTMASFLKY
jgi:hypothetical protein